MCRPRGRTRHSWVGAAIPKHAKGTPSQTAMAAAKLRRARFPTQPRNLIAGTIHSHRTRLTPRRMRRALVDAAIVNGTKHRISRQAGIAAYPRRTTFPAETRRRFQDCRTPYSAEEPDRWDNPLRPNPINSEADAACLGGRGNRERDKASDFKASWYRRVPKEDDVPRGDEATLPRLQTPSGEQADPAGPRELILVPDQPRRSTYLVTPAEFVDPEVTYRLPRAPRSGKRIVVYELMIAFQLAIATLAVAAFYVAMWGRNSSVQAAKDMPVAAGQTASEGMTAIAPSLTTAPAAAALPFPRPTDYGVYALRSNQLIELELGSGTAGRSASPQPATDHSAGARRH